MEFVLVSMIWFIVGFMVTDLIQIKFGNKNTVTGFIIDKIKNRGQK